METAKNNMSTDDVNTWETNEIIRWLINDESLYRYVRQELSTGSRREQLEQLKTVVEKVLPTLMENMNKAEKAAIDWSEIANCVMGQ